MLWSGAGVPQTSMLLGKKKTRVADEFTGEVLKKLQEKNWGLFILRFQQIAYKMQASDYDIALKYFKGKRYEPLFQHMCFTSQRIFKDRINDEEDEKNFLLFVSEQMMVYTWEYDLLNRILNGDIIKDKMSIVMGVVNKKRKQEIGEKTIMKLIKVLQKSILKMSKESFEELYNEYNTQLTNRNHPTLCTNTFQWMCGRVLNGDDENPLFANIPRLIGFYDDQNKQNQSLYIAGSEEFCQVIQHIQTKTGNKEHTVQYIVEKVMNYAQGIGKASGTDFREFAGIDMCESGRNTGLTDLVLGHNPALLTPPHSPRLQQSAAAAAAGSRQRH